MPEMVALAADAPAAAADPVPADAEHAVPPPVETSVRLKKGDTIARVLSRLGVVAGEVAEVVAALAEHVPMQRLPIGQAITVKIRPADEADAEPVLLALSIRPEPRRKFIARARRGRRLQRSRRRSSKSPRSCSARRERSTAR